MINNNVSALFGPKFYSAMINPKQNLCDRFAHIALIFTCLCECIESNDQISAIDTEVEIGLALSYLERNKQSLFSPSTHPSISGILELTSGLLLLYHQIHLFNAMNPIKIDLDLFEPIKSFDDYEALADIITQLYDVALDIEYSEYRDEDNPYDCPLGLFRALYGDNSEIGLYLDSNYGTVYFPDPITLRTSSTYYELWDLIDLSAHIRFINWGINGANVNIDSRYNYQDDTSKLERQSPLEARLKRHREIKNILSRLSTQVLSSKKESNNKDWDILSNRIYALTAITDYMIDTTITIQSQENQRAKKEERNLILSNLSHSIKNMLKAVIDPLQNLRDEIPQKAVIIDNAIKGANLIREIVNSINHSFQTTLEELKWDVLHPGEASMTLQEMVVDSLKYSVSNMFDSRYFPAFSEKYFPRSLDKAQYDRIKHNWNEVSATSLDEIKGFLDKYMFKLELSLDESQDYHVGNEKSSAIKLHILFQEIIFNAVKYAAYVPFPDRRVEITLASHGYKIVLAVKNSFDPKVQAKTTGVGKLVIENFAKILECSPEIEETGNTYSISLEFDNLWHRKEADA